MGNWLLMEEPSFPDSYPVLSGTGAAEADYSILLRKVRILDNRRMFGRPANILLYCIIVNGFPDMESRRPFWSQQLTLPAIRDGDIRNFDDGGESGYLIFHGKPRDFINLYIIAFKDDQDTREFAKILQESFVAEGIGNVVGALVPIFGGPAGVLAAPIARQMTNKAIDSTLNYYKNRGNPIIDIYYGSLLRNKNFGVGLHPTEYDPRKIPPQMLEAGAAFALAYEVVESYE